MTRTFVHDHSRRLAVVGSCGQRLAPLLAAGRSGKSSAVGKSRTAVSESACDSLTSSCLTLGIAGGGDSFGSATASSDVGTGVPRMDML
ncbi:hypothetical protein Mp_2g13080 [Marchantia polymorpha subsp. ruderalis]|uniref:Uncharacterized protein n=1 Tax=Marchantia polymorpha TaxID=3197 RepID=A0A2R6XAQ0_MARPO|nr:hypothetical protein MARPO_0026s0064 [Marchantia polymorpha]BBN02135.1 hypothetical protein Mp_2g13080 [Marchantia polymorpha subsp. ruderalis]|eukprot:PTQ43185.1 hypothetical protein MARPO_0026s0064 [Marchantia polymorpha]